MWPASLDHEGGLPNSGSGFLLTSHQTEMVLLYI